MSSRARAVGEVAGDLRPLLLRPELWLGGLVGVQPGGPGRSRWRLQTPVGTLEVLVEVRVGDGEVVYRAPAPPQPLSALEVSAALRGSRLEVEVAVESDPPLPPGTVEGVAHAALARLRALAARNPLPLGPLPEPEALSVEVSDGARLALHLYRAQGREAAPCLVLLTPYRKESAWVGPAAQALTAAGFHLLVADVRGFGGSAAPYEGLWSPREVADGVELVEWAAAQPFSGGRVGMVGPSYQAGIQLLVAARKPRGLGAIAPVVGMVDTYRDWTHRGGIPSHAAWGAGTYLRSQHRDTVRRGLEEYAGLYVHGLDSELHRSRSPERYLDRIEVPTLCVGGWHDYFLRGTVRTYLGVRGPKRLVVGPWGHGDWQAHDELVQWFAYWLEGRGPDPNARGRVRLYRGGAEAWVDLPDWPDPSSRRWWAWHPVGAPAALRVHTHLEAVPPAPNPRPQFVPDPTDSGMSLWGEDAVFETGPLPSATLLEGPVALVAVLRVQGCEDLDLHARLSVVGADGWPRQLTEGRLRASHRSLDLARSLLSPSGEVVVPWHPHDRPEPLPQDRPVTLVVEVDPVSQRLEPGERLRLGLTLARSDEGAVAALAHLDPQTRVLLPVAPEGQA